MRRTLPVVAAIGTVPDYPARAHMAADYGSRTLKVGSSGSDVRALQRYLDGAGYDTDVTASSAAARARAYEFERPRAAGPTARPRAPSSACSPARGREESADGRIDRTSGEGGAGSTRRSGLRGSGEEAYIGDDGLAVAPASAPEEVKAIIAAGNKIASKPYKYGGGHGRWRDCGYDCSGLGQLRAARGRPARYPARLRRLHALGRERPR